MIWSEPVTFTKEFRAFVHDSRVVTQSRYAFAGDLSPSSRDADSKLALRFAQEVVDATPGCSPPALVVDVGPLASGDWAVVEANPAFGAGIYEAESDRVLDVLLQAVVRADRLRPDWAPFTFPVELE